jgi:AcrR family transcriptional regulator
MSRPAAARSQPVGRRPTLTRAKVLQAAVDLADREGLDAVSMRRLGQELGVEAMSLYTHVRNKDDLLDGMADLVVSEAPLASPSADWKPVLRTMILAARAVLHRHRWAPAILESRSDPGPATLRYIDAVIGTLRGGGLAIDVTHHALHVLGSRVLGFSQDLFDDSAEMSAEEAIAFAAHVAHSHPHVAEVALAASHEGGLGPCDDDVEFRFALDLILDGLERASASDPAGGAERAA